MSLILVIYLLSLLDPINALVSFIAIISTLTSIITMLWFMEDYEYSWNKDADGNFKPHVQKLLNFRKQVIKIAPVVALSLWFITILIPSQKTAYMMMGAYVGEEIIKSKTADAVANSTTEILGKVNKIINQKLDEYIEQDDTKEVKK